MSYNRERKRSVKLLAGVVIAAIAFLSWELGFFVNRTSKADSTRQPEQTVATLQKAGNAKASFPRRSSLSDERAAEVSKLTQRILALLRDENANGAEIYLKLLPALVKLDPQAAAAFAQSLQAAKWRSQLMMVVAQSWAALDPDEAQRWASNVQSLAGRPTERDTIVSYVCLQIAHSDPGRAVQVLRECPINNDRREIVVESLAQVLATKDLQPLADWVGTLPEGVERDDLFKRVALAQAQSSPARAARTISEKIAPGDIQKAAALEVVREWAWTDQQAAARWVSAFPAGDLRDEAAKELEASVSRRRGQGTN